MELKYRPESPSARDVLRNQLVKCAGELIAPPNGSQRVLKALAIADTADGELLIYAIVLGEKRADSWYHKSIGRRVEPELPR